MMSAISNHSQTAFANQTDPQYRSLRSKLIKFRLIYHDGQALVRGPITDLLISTADTADTVTCRVLKAFGMPGATHALMHFTAPKAAGKRVVPNYFGIHEHTEVFVQIRMIERAGLDLIMAGVKRLGLGDEDVKMTEPKRICLAGGEDDWR